jgi:hypothetical protein
MEKYKILKSKRFHHRFVNNKYWEYYRHKKLNINIHISNRNYPSDDSQEAEMIILASAYCQTDKDAYVIFKTIELFRGPRKRSLPSDKELNLLLLKTAIIK